MSVIVAVAHWILNDDEHRKYCELNVLNGYTDADSNEIIIIMVKPIRHKSASRLNGRIDLLADKVKLEKIEVTINEGSYNLQRTKFQGPISLDYADTTMFQRISRFVKDIYNDVR